MLQSRKVKVLPKIGKNLTLFSNVTDALALSTSKASLIPDTVAEKAL